MPRSCPAAWQPARLTAQAVEQEIGAAIRFHIEGLRADGLDVPAPTSIADYVEA
jgi:predicted RNase H-like HicB family nuclease